MSPVEYKVKPLPGFGVTRKLLRNRGRASMENPDVRMKAFGTLVEGCTSNPVLVGYAARIIDSISGSPVTKPSYTSTESFLKLMSKMDMKVDMRLSKDLQGEDQFPEDADTLCHVLPYMYQMNIVLMAKMLVESMYTLKVLPDSAAQFKQVFDSSWLGEPEHQWILSMVSDLIMPSIMMALKAEREGKGELFYDPRHAAASRLDSEQAPDVYVGLMFIADMLFNEV